MLVGFCSSLVATFILTPDAAANFFHVATPLTPATREYWDQGIATFLNVFVGTLWFFGTKFFWARSPADYKARVETFFAGMVRPINLAGEEGAGNDARQSKFIGWMCLVYGSFVGALALIPNPAVGRVAFLFCGGLVAGIGGLLLAASRRPPVT